MLNVHVLTSSAQLVLLRLISPHSTVLFSSILFVEAYSGPRCHYNFVNVNVLLEQGTSVVCQEAQGENQFKWCTTFMRKSIYR